MICGEGSSSSGVDQFVRLRDQGTAFEKRDIQVYSESESGKIEVVDFNLTSRSCIKINPQQTKESRSKLTIIYKNRLAGQLNPKKIVRNIPLLELEDCREYCAAYPSCGLIEAPRNLAGTSTVVLKVPTSKGEKINATLENDSFNTVLNLNEKNCFLLPSDAKGTLRLQDSLGNFLEKSADDAFRFGSASAVTELKNVPNLKTLSIAINASEGLKEVYWPSKLESLDLTSWGLKNLEILKPLKELKDLKIDLSYYDLEADQEFIMPKVETITIQTAAHNFLKFPTFPNAISANLYLTRGDNTEPSTIPRAAGIFPALQTINLWLGKSNMLLLKQFSSPSTVVLYATDADLSDLPFLPLVKTFKLSSADLEDLNGIENFPGLNNIEFINGSNPKTLQPLLSLKKLERIIGSRFIRKNFPTPSSCPETPDAPPGLQRYCSDIMMPIVRMFGPATF